MLVRKCIFSIIPPKLFEAPGIKVDMFYIAEYPDILKDPNSVECRVAKQFEPKLGDEIASTINSMSIRLRFSPDSYHQLLMINLGEGQNITREELKLLLSSMSTERLKEFIKEAEFKL